MKRKQIVLGMVVLLASILPFSGYFAMSNGSFNSLLGSLENESFSDDKISVLESSSGSNTFTCSQVKAILGKFSMSSDKLDALRTVKDRIEDLENKHVILGAFNFSGDKKKASQILATARSANRGNSGGSNNSFGGGGFSSGGGGGGECQCYAICSGGQRDVLQVVNDGPMSYKSNVCQQKAMQFCSSFNAQVRKSNIKCN